MVGILCLVFFAPLLVLAAITIRLDSPGPVFSLQDRCGFKKTIRRYTIPHDDVTNQAVAASPAAARF
jgi:Bacterial sugar transferase